MRKQQLNSAGQITTNILSCLCVVFVIALPWIHMRYSLWVENVSVGLELQHLARHIVAELLNLFSGYLKNVSLDHLPFVTMV